MATTPLSIPDFAAKVRAKYPGAYDKLSDPELVQKVVTKYPDYKDHIASYAETDFEKQRDPNRQPGAIPAIGNAIGNAASGVASAIGAGLGGPAAMGANAVKAGTQLYSDDQNRQDAGRSPAYRAVAGLGEGLGVADPVSMEHSADIGDTAGILGSAGTSAALAASPYLARGAGALRGAVGDAMRDPYGSPKGASAIKPGLVDTVSRVGKYVGGPAVADYLVPERSAGPTGPYSPLSNRLPPAVRGDPFAPAPQAAAPPELGSTENPGPFSPLPNKLPPNLRGDPFSPTPTAYQSPIGDIPSEEGVAGSVPKPSGRLVLLPSEAAAADQLQSIAKTRASQHGMQYAAGMRPAGGGRVPQSPTPTVTTDPFMTPQALQELKAKLGLQ
jgi:hypothetical protein